MGVPVFHGRFGERQAERLLWRAGFGPRPGDARRLAHKGLKRAVLSLTRPKGKAKLSGPKPHTEDGLPLAPADAYGHDLLWWLDRMVRSDQQLIERMTLVWHDWFATADVGNTRLNLVQNQLFRKHALGSFGELLIDVTKDPAMLLWLSGADNAKWEPNENYAREQMELFTLGVNNGYTETDVREHARALTGWRYDWDENVGQTNFRFDPEYHDNGVKKIFGKSGRFSWQDSCELCLGHPAHPDYFIDKLWSYFVPTAPPSKTRKELKRMYAKKKGAVLPLVEAILMHPAVYEGPRMVKPPIVQIAGMLRARKTGIKTESWTWISEEAGQRLFQPPNVAGWNESRWLDTARVSGRWEAGGELSNEAAADEENYDPKEGAEKAVKKALGFWGNPTISKQTEGELLKFARGVEAIATEDWQESSYRALRQNALRMLIASSPDFQTS